MRRVFIHPFGPPLVLFLGEKLTRAKPGTVQAPGARKNNARGGKVLIKAVKLASCFVRFNPRADAQWDLVSKSVWVRVSVRVFVCLVCMLEV